MSRRHLSSLLAVGALSATALAGPALATGEGLARPLPDRGGAIALVVAEAIEDYQWMALDGHLHTDHSHDAGFTHQQDKAPQNHDTFLDDQRDQAVRVGMDAVAFTDHRTFSQHYDPAYQSDDAVLITGEEWGGGRHATAFGISEVLENGSTSRTGCGVAEMTLEAAAQDALLGLAHPKDGETECIDIGSFVTFPMSHVEALRGGNNPLQDEGLLPANGTNIDYYVSLLRAGGRVAAFNGSDNHFKQVWAGPSGPGGSATYALVRDPSDAGLREAVRNRRTIAGLGITGPRVTTLLDADRDGTFDALTGGWAAPTADAVTVAVRVELGSGRTVQLFDDADRLVAQEPVAAPDTTLAFEVPAASAYYRATVVTEPLTRVGLPDPLDYLDTVEIVSSPVWTTAPSRHGESPRLSTGPATHLSSADWSGFPRLARSGDVVHAVWQERSGTQFRVTYARSADDGTTFAAPQTLSTSPDARMPAVAADGDQVVVVWEDHNPGRLGGNLVAVASDNGGVSFGQPEVVAEGNATRPAIAADGGAFHLAWTQQRGTQPWSISYAKRTDGGWSAASQLSGASAWECCEATYAVPPRTVMHVPASVNPTVAARQGTVVVAWEDNREDPTPLRNGTPDDWGIWAATSKDGGATFGDDQRVSPRHVARDEATAEGVEGNPARQVDAVVLDDGSIVLAYSDPFGSGAANVWAQRSPAAGSGFGDPVAIAPPSSEWEYRPRLLAHGQTVRAVWQQSEDPTWHLASAVSGDGGRSFSPAEKLTTAGRYAGWPTVTDGVVAFTAETPDGFAVHSGALPTP